MYLFNKRKCLKLMSSKSALAAARRLTMEQPLQTATAHPAGTRDMAVQMKRKKRKNTAAVVSGTMVAESSLISSYAITTTILVALGIARPQPSKLLHHAPVVAARPLLQASH